MLLHFPNLFISSSLCIFFLFLCLSFYRILHLYTPSKYKQQCCLICNTKKQTKLPPLFLHTTRSRIHICSSPHKFTKTRPHTSFPVHTHTHAYKITLPHKWTHLNTYSTYSVVAQITTSPSQCVVMSADPNGNHSGIDSGYAPSNIEDAVAGTADNTISPQESPQHRKRTDSSGTLKRSSLNKRNGIDGSPKREAVR